MRAVASQAPVLSGDALRRADGALAARRKPSDIDLPAARAEFATLMGSAGA